MRPTESGALRRIAQRLQLRFESHFHILEFLHVKRRSRSCASRLSRHVDDITLVVSQPQVLQSLPRPIFPTTAFALHTSQNPSFHGDLDLDESLTTNPPFLYFCFLLPPPIP